MQNEQPAAPPAARKPIGKKMRFEVFKRDAFSCQYCGAHPPDSILHVDHIVPVALGGGNEIENLITACDPCNLGKGATSLDAAEIALDSGVPDRAVFKYFCGVCWNKVREVQE